MKIDRKYIGVVVVLMLVGIFAVKLWPDSSNAQQAGFAPTKISGPAIILFRGDNSANCRAIHQLVDQAAHRYQDRISVVQTGWSPDNPLIKKYQIRFCLPWCL